MTSRQRRGVRHLVRRLRKSGSVTGLELIVALHRARGGGSEIVRRLLKCGGEQALNQDAIVWKGAR